MKTLGLLATVLALALLQATPASADFGLSNLQVGFSSTEGGVATQAGSHPLGQEIGFKVNSREEAGGTYVEGALRNLDVVAPAGLVGNPTAVQPCTTIEFLREFNGHPSCANSSAVGILEVTLANLGLVNTGTVPVYNLVPSPGVPAKLGFVLEEVPITVNIGIQPTFPYNLVGSLRNTSQVLEVVGSKLTLWGNPANPAHNGERGLCGYSLDPKRPTNCPVEANTPEKPFLTLPRSCSGPLPTIFEATSWWSGEDPEHPGPPTEFKEGATSAGMTNCAALGFKANLNAQATTQSADSASGLTVEFNLTDDGIGAPKGTAHSDIQKAVLTLPEGMTANPGLAEGLATCSEADLQRESAFSEPGEGCPQASKVGTIEVETPVLENKTLKGELFIATPNDPSTPGQENPFNTLLALYMVIKDPELGVVVKVPGRIDPDPKTGQLVTTFDKLPPFPVSHFTARLREGGRSPLISPPTCGTYPVTAQLTPSGNPGSPVTVNSSFQVNRGVGGGPCPAAGPPPFDPGFSAGTLNNNAKTYSPTLFRLTRPDGNQDLTRFDATLAPGLLAKIAGVGQCPDAAIEAAKAKSGRAELAAPSCPASSQIGTVIGGAGVGSELTYAPGKLYLAGPFGGDPLSVVGIVPAVAGPFDVGTVVVRQALDVNPTTAAGEIDGAHSDPIPHILAGIPLRVKEIRVLADRPSFTLNPTNCDPFAIKAQIWGGGANAFSTADDSPVSRSSRFQAANCSRLGFKPKHGFNLKGGTKRGDNPQFQAVIQPRAADANMAKAVVRLPHSAFLDQSHIRTVCTRVQFAAGAGHGANCPKGSIYGHVRAFTPLLEGAAEGPVILRSSSHPLPDLVFALTGPPSAQVHAEAAGRIDSIKGGIRVTFATIPDVPLSKVVLKMLGGKKGLIVNSTNLCKATHRADLEFVGQNGRTHTARPVIKATGCKSRHRRGAKK